MQSITLMGEHDVRLSEDNTFVLPSEIRRQLKALGDISFRVDFGTNGALWLHPLHLRLVVSRENGASENRLSVTSNSSMPVDLKRDGHLRIPHHFRSACDLGSELTLIGVGDHLELWNRATWEDYRSQLLS